nr:hypothetical protein [Candidatus Sigynarchaeota archaeon]
MTNDFRRYCRRCIHDRLNGGDEAACRAGCYRSGLRNNTWPRFKEKV